MARVLVLLLAVLAVVGGACGSDDDGDVGTGPLEPTTTVADDEPSASGDCAAHDDEGMCIDDPERSLYEPDPDECPPEAECIEEPGRERAPDELVERMRPACDAFQDVLGSQSDESITVGEAQADLDVLIPAFVDWVASARAVDAPRAAQARWAALVEEADATTAAADAAFRALLADVDPSRRLDELFEQLPASAAADFDASTSALDAVDDFLGVDCVS